MSNNLFGQLLGLSSGGGGGTITPYDPGSVDFSFALTGDAATADGNGSFFGDGDTLFRCAIVATVSETGEAIVDADLRASVGVFFSFATSRRSADHDWVAATWLYGHVAGLQIVGTLAAPDALATGTYYAHIRLVNSTSQVMREASLGVITVP